MNKLTEIFVTAAVGAAFGGLATVGGGLLYLGGMKTRVWQLEQDVAELKRRPLMVQQAADPIRARCADLAYQVSRSGAGAVFASESMKELNCSTLASR